MPLDEVEVSFEDKENAVNGKISEESAMQNWNPMNEAFRNINFNSYAAGPGAQLSAELQHSAVIEETNENAEKKSPYLCIKKASKLFNAKGLYNLFSNYAKVTNVKYIPSCEYFFVEFKFLPQMQKAYDALKENPFGIEIYFGLEKDRPTYESSLPAPPKNVKEIQEREDYIDRKKPDLSVRTFKGPFYRPPYSQHGMLHKYARKSCIDDATYDVTNCHVVDPQKHFAFGVDMWDRENPIEKDGEDVEGELVVVNGSGYYRNSTSLEVKIAKDLPETKGHIDKENKLVVQSKSQILSKFSSSECEFCGRNTFNRCDQCLHFFCTIECLKNDSKTHNDTCKRSRREQKAHISTGVNDGTILFRKHLKSGCEVTVVSVLQPNIFFVRVTGEIEDSEHLKNLDKIYNLSKKIEQPIGHFPVVGEIVFCKFYTRGFNRALILDSAELNNIAVVFIDYGNIHYLPLEEIYPISNEHFSIPRTLFPIALKEVDKFYANKKIQQYLESLIEKDHFRLSFAKDQLGKNIKEVVLIDMVNNENVNETINEMRIFPVPDIHKDIFYSIPKLPIKEMVTMDYVLMNISYVEQTYMVSVIPKKDIPNLLEFEDEIQVYASKNHQYYTPRENELCLVKQKDDRWYRGQCFEVVGDGVPSIEFIDYGHIDTIPIEDIRMYPKQFIHPLATVSCMIEGIPETYHPEVGKLLKSKLEFGMRVEAYIETQIIDNESTQMIYIPKLIKLLKKTKY
ncbi:hypothetical protein ACFFRR_006923 [Megaselia abdita]